MLINETSNLDIYCSLSLTVSSLSSAQILKGKITNQAAIPFQYSTVYIQELKQGTTSNTKGDYEIKLPAGKYTVIYQSLGYPACICQCHNLR